MQINSKVAELVGILLGDGSISVRKDKGQNRIKISFNSLELQYINFVSNILNEVFSVKPILKFRKSEQTADLFLFKEIFVKQVLELGLETSPKWNRAKIPDKFLDNDMELDVLRGYFDTDGSVVLTNNNGTLYPRLEMKVCPSPMQKQFPEILEKNGFRFGFYNCGNGEKRIQINGKRQLQKWLDLIGFHNEKHLLKAKKILEV